MARQRAQDEKWSGWVVVQFRSAMSLNVEKDFHLPLGMTTKISICRSLILSERIFAN